ncbi:MAG: sigma-70 family RNA polymerase sigma factor [Bacteroidaceae bacterium]|nr:sigma-70 family RNA polymerase sigma factor [Bacteroidaceae bacterium]
MSPATFTALVPALRQAALQAARAVGADAETAEDTAQDVLLRLWLMHGEIDETRSPAVLAAVMARNRAVSLLRHERALPVSSLPTADTTTLTAHATPEELLEHRDLLQWLEQRMARLPSSQYAILQLRHRDQRTTAEIAALLGFTPRSVEVLLSRARRTLIEEMKNRERL